MKMNHQDTFGERLTHDLHDSSIDVRNNYLLYLILSLKKLQKFKIASILL